MFKANFKNFRITANYTGSKAAKWNNHCDNWNHHNVTVVNTDNGKRTRFDFWASLANPVVDSVEDVCSAFACFVSDAIAGAESFNNFCAEFGYDDDSITALKTYRACKRAYNKLSRIYAGDIYDLANDLSEQGYY